MEINKVTLEQIVTFAILMENNEGIIGKAPSYIKEKLICCMEATNPKHLEDMLDSSNRAKLQVWRERWKYLT